MVFPIKTSIFLWFSQAHWPRMWKRFFWANGWRWCPQGTTWNHHMNPDRKMYQDSSPVMLDTVWWRSRQQCSRRYRIFASSVPKQSPKCGYITFFEHNVSWRRPEEVWSKILVGGFKHFFIFHHIWDVILPIDELHHFSRWLLHHHIICTYLRAAIH